MSEKAKSIGVPPLTVGFIFKKWLELCIRVTRVKAKTPYVLGSNLNKYSAAYLRRSRLIMEKLCTS